MGAIQLERESEAVYRLAGELTHDSVAQFAEQNPLLGMPSGGDLSIDLSGVSRSDSSGLALLISWAREAKQQNTVLSFAQVPEKMKSLAKVSGLDAVLVLN